MKYFLLVSLSCGLCIHALEQRFPLRNIQQQKNSAEIQIENLFVMLMQQSFLFSTIGLWTVPGKQSGISEVNLTKL